MHIKPQQHQTHVVSAVNVVDGTLYIASFRKKDIQKVSHALLRLFLVKSASRLFSYSENAGRVTLILDKQALSTFPQECLTISHGWRGLEVTLGECGYTESGIISKLTTALSKHRISIHYLSTYNTDYILVPEHQLAETISCFLQNFNIEISTNEEVSEEAVVDSSGCYRAAPEVPKANEPQRSTKLITSPHSLCLASIDKEDSPLCMDAILNHIFFPKRNDSYYFFSFTETPNELSLIMDRRDVDDFPQITCMSRKLLVETQPWRAIKRAEKANAQNPDETGFVNSVSTPLADAKISLLYLSIHNSSVILVRENYIQDAVKTLRDRGFEVMSSA